MIHMTMTWVLTFITLLHGVVELSAGDICEYNKPVTIIALLCAKLKLPLFLPCEKNIKGEKKLSLIHCGDIIF